MPLKPLAKSSENSTTNNFATGSLSRSFIFIFLSVIVISGPALLGLLYYQSLKTKRLSDDKYLIKNIVQMGEDNSHLPSDYLCELLELSADKPTNLFRLKNIEAARRLYQSSLIEKASVTKVLPNTLIIQIKKRVPLAFIGNFENIAIDKNGYLFPYKPSPPFEKLPTFHIEDFEIEWEQKIQTPSFFIALKIYTLFNKEELSSIDVSRINDPSYGRREIVVVVNSHTLRLNPENPIDGIAKYFTLLDSFPLRGREVIDLRIEHMAFVLP